MNNDIPGPTPEEAHRVLIRTRLKIKTIDAIAEIIRQQKPEPQAYREIVELMQPYLKA